VELDKRVKEYFKAVNDSCNSIEFTYDKKNSLYIPLFSSAIEHCIAIHVLDKKELTGSESMGSVTLIC
jgi:hypothetical protein